MQRSFYYPVLICLFYFYANVAASYMFTEHMHFMNPVQFQDQGQRPVSLVSRVPYANWFLGYI